MTRMPSLDGLRALSLIIVLFGHLAYTAGFPIAHNWWTDVYAHFGVRIFFVLSGFLITTLLLQERESFGHISLTRFYVRRAYRTLPVAYCYLAVVTGLFGLSMGRGELVMAWTFVTSYVRPPSWVLGHLWSLSVEEQFYLLWPLALLCGFSKRAAWAALVVAPIARIVLAKTGFGLDADYSFPVTVDSIASGCLLAIYRDRVPFLSPRLIWPALLLMPALAHAGHVKALWPLPQFAGHSAITLFNLAVVLCIHQAVAHPPRILNAGPVVWLGTMSYSLYIWQMLFTNPELSSWMTAFPANLLLIFATAAVSHYAIELPMVRLGKATTRLRKIPASSAAHIQPPPDTEPGALPTPR